MSAVGDTVTYTFLVTNTGNVGLTGVSVDDTQAAARGRPGVGSDVPVVVESVGDVLGLVDVARAWAVGDVHRHLHRDAGGS